MDCDAQWGTKTTIENLLVKFYEFKFFKGDNPKVKYHVEEDFQKQHTTYELTNLVGGVDGQGDSKVVVFDDEYKCLSIGNIKELYAIMYNSIKEVRHSANEDVAKYVAKIYLPTGCITIMTNH